QAPAATWQIVGRNPPRAVQDLAGRAGIDVTGTVPDVRPFLEAATVAVAPLLVGGGTRLKILEALATGTAVVSTSLGCEGLEVVSGRDLLIADDAERFARSVVDLLENAAMRSALGRDGREVAERYDWPRCTQPLTAALEAIA